MGKAKEGILFYLQEKWEKNDDNKNAPEEFGRLSLSIEDAQGKMDLISSILIILIMFFKNNIFKKEQG